MTKDQRSKDPTVFSLFPSFPVEIQLEIYKQAFPEPSFIGLSFSIRKAMKGEGNPRIWAFNSEPQGVLSLLLACNNSKDEIFRQYEELVFNLPILGKSESNMERFISHVYIRPNVDTLVIYAPKLLELYELGGCLTLENITSLVLSELDPGLWGLCDEGPIGDAKMQYQAKFYTMISTHCPALRNFSLLFESWDRTYNNRRPECWTIIDISDGCVDLDWNTELLEQFALKQVERSFAQSILYTLLLKEKMHNVKFINDYARRILRDFNRFRNTNDDDAWDIPGKETLEYWAKLRPALSILAYCTNHYESDRCGCKAPMREVYVPTAELYLRIHKDGTPVKKYTDWAQLLDDAQWLGERCRKHVDRGTGF